MSTEAYCPSGNCSSVGVDAVSLERFADLTTENGDLLVYDETIEDAWIQSDLYVRRDSYL